MRAVRSAKNLMSTVVSVKNRLSCQQEAGKSVCVCFSCGDVGRLFCHVEPQIEAVIGILQKVQYNDDVLLEKLEKILADLRHRLITEHFQQFVYSFISVLLTQ